MPENISQRIADIVGAWEGVTVQRHRFGGVEFRVRQRQIGHIHGDRMADLLFSLRERRLLVSSGSAYPHHILPGTGWVSFPIRSVHDIPAVISLMRQNYERLCGKGRRAVTTHLSNSTQMLPGRTPDDLPA